MQALSGDVARADHRQNERGLAAAVIARPYRTGAIGRRGWSDSEILTDRATLCRITPVKAVGNQSHLHGPLESTAAHGFLTQPANPFHLRAAQAAHQWRSQRCAS